jgi:uncharacterized protein YjdB
MLAGPPASIHIGTGGPFACQRRIRADMKEASMYREWTAVRRPAKSLILVAAAVLVINCDSGSLLSPTGTGKKSEPVDLRLEFATSAVAEQDTVIMKAVLLDRDGQSIPGATFEWSSSAPRILSIQSVTKAEGLLVAHKPGTASITVSHQTLTKSTIVEVHNRPIDLVYVSGSGQAAAGGTLLQDSLVVAVIDRRGDPVSDVIIEFRVGSGGGSLSPTSGVTDVRGQTRTAWTIGVSGEQRATAQVSAAQPRVKTVKDSVVVFTARVVPDVVSLDVSPDSATLEEGDSLRLVVSAATSSGSQLEDPDVTWESSDTTITTVSPNGVLRARKPGAARAIVNMTSTSGSISASAMINVVATAAIPNPLTVRPSSASLETGATLQFEAIGIMSDGSQEPVPASWSTTGGSIDGNGYFTAGSTAGNFRVVAVHAEGFADTAVVSVVAPTAPLAGVIISPATDTINSLGATTRFDARAVDSSGADMADVIISWSSLNENVASVKAGGSVTAKAAGSALIVAAAAGFADTALVVVQQVPATVTVEPAKLTLVVGQTQQLEATVRDAGGSPILGSGVSWNSSSPGVASVSVSGLLKALDAGAAVVMAVAGEIGGEALVEVEAATPPADTFGLDQRPYTPNSPWNTPIPLDAPVDPRSAEMVATIESSNNGKLRSDPSRYTYPVHFVDASTPRTTLVCTGYVSVNNEDGTRTSMQDKKLTNVPIPPDAVPSEGSDGQLILVDIETGDEFDIWRFMPPNGCENATKYVAGVYRDAGEKSYISRGAGVPYLAGLIRPWEIDQGRIEHALAFAYSLSRATRCVWPASKTDGKNHLGNVIPQGARIRLDPTLDVDTINGLDETGRIIARALQEYGMFLIDNSGANKIYAEDNLTANWGIQLVVTTVSAIPVDRLQVLRLPDAYWADDYVPNHGKCVR